MQKKARTRCLTHMYIKWLKCNCIDFTECRPPKSGAEEMTKIGARNVKLQLINSL